MAAAPEPLGASPGEGRHCVHVRRTVPGTVEAVSASLMAWMPRMETLLATGRTEDRETLTLRWSPRRDRRGNRLRALGFGGRRLDLVLVDAVTARCSATDAQQTAIHLTAEVTHLGPARRLRTGILLGLLGALTVVVSGWVLREARDVAAIGAALLGLGSGVGCAALVVRQVLVRAEDRARRRVQARLTTLLDALEQGTLTPPAWPRLPGPRQWRVRRSPA